MFAAVQQADVEDAAVMLTPFSSLQVRRRWKPYREYVVLSASEEDGDALRPRNNLPPSEPSAPRPGSGSGPASGGWPHHGRQGRQQGLQQGRPADVDCLAALHAAFHELQLVRTQRRPLRGPRALRVKGAAAKGVAARAPRHELLLGDVHSRPDQRNVYRPTAFQVPLLRVDKALEERQVSPCRRQGVCARALSASHRYAGHAPAALSGQSSVVHPCDTRCSH